MTVSPSPHPPSDSLSLSCFTSLSFSKTGSPSKHFLSSACDSYFVYVGLIACLITVIFHKWLLQEDIFRSLGTFSYNISYCVSASSFFVYVQPLECHILYFRIIIANAYTVYVQMTFTTSNSECVIFTYLMCSNNVTTSESWCRSAAVKVVLAEPQH